MQKRLGIVRCLFLVCGLIGLFAAQGFADLVRLKNGNSLKGIIVESDDADVVRIEVGIGKVVLNRDEIAEIELSSSKERGILQQQWQQEREKIADAQEEQKIEAKEESVESPAEPEVAAAAVSVPVKKIPKQLRSHIVNRPLHNSYYLLSVPQNVDKEKGSALIIALHGWPSDPESFMGAWKAEGNRTQSFIACPKSISQGWSKYDVDNMFKMVEDIKSNYNINPKKVFLVGVSNGAHFALYLGLKYPKVFKSIVIVAGSIGRARRNIGELDLSERKRRVPVLILIGAKDEKVRIENARKTKLELRKYRYPVTYRVIPGFGHGYLMEFSQDITKWLGI